MSTYDSLVKKLKEIFQIDQADLDFGIYRILRSRSDEIISYLESDLKAKVEESLSKAELGDAGEIKAALDEAVKGALALGADPDTLPKIQTLKKQLEETKRGSESYANEVFAHLETFFGRYYDKGDFISRRRYKGETYAIPYDGEEVVLHWANKDQYYTKSAEQFTNYAFSLSDGRRVHIKLVSAETSKDNRKDAEKERRFVLATDHVEVEMDEEGEAIRTSVPTVIERDGELIIHFRYEAQPKGTKQADLNDNASAIIKKDPLIIQNWADLFSPNPTETNPTRTLFDKQLADFTAKNTSDYFIHKNLKVFLTRELDFYIKNEVMHLDDIQDVKTFRSIEHRLRMIQVLREIALDLVSFLAQIEDFQKKLWLKKKFIVRSDYCITLDRVPREFYADIVKNKEQAEEWQRLGFLESAKITDKILEEHQYMMVDTKFFPVSFKYALLSKMENIDAQTDGLLIHSENFQALNLLQSRYKEQVKCVYLDPPYNANSSEILYKNTFKHSSWCSLIENRLTLGRSLLSEDYSHIIAIDEVEQELLGQIISSIFLDSIKACLTIVHNPRGQQGKNISYLNEFAYFTYPNDKRKFISDLKRSEVDARILRDSGTESNRTDAATCFYPFYIKENRIIRIGNVPLDSFHPDSGNIFHEDGTIEIWPIDDNGNEKKWRYSVNSVHKILPKLTVKKGRNTLQIIFNQDMGVMKSTWVDAKYDASEYGTKVLQSILGLEDASKFSYPKSINTVLDSIRAGSGEYESPLILDYFAGSGTTGHAVINLNREDGGNRKYILVEMGEYFDTVLKPRIEKVVYSSDWKEGKPQKKESGVSHCFKYFSMESYEDTLNNLTLIRTLEQQDMLKAMTKDAQQDYLLHYMLDMESRNILSIEHFKKPFDYTMNIAVDTSGASKPMNIDLVETFNYLIGLKVEHIHAELERGFLYITGENLAGEKLFILWRDCDKVGYDEVLRITEKLKLRPGDSEYDILYINGDTTVPNYLTTDDGGSRSLKVRLIEDEFLHAMFDVQDVL